MATGTALEPHAHTLGPGDLRQQRDDAGGCGGRAVAGARRGRALWAPPNVVHAIEMRGAVAMRTIYVPPERAGALPPQCAALEIECAAARA